jgi:hypothetical protein
MTPRVHHIFVALSILALSAACSQNQNQDPCDENPNLIICNGSETGTYETGGMPEEAFCAPFEPGVNGESYECQGNGNGWLELDVYPIGAQDPECLSWGDEERPEHPTTEDCVAIEITSLPNDVPSPGACCGYEASPEHITQQCNDDCGYAACNLAIAKLRDAALALPTEGAKGIVRLDLFYFANLLESPDVLDACAQQVSDANGELTPVALGAGASPELDFGHVNSAVLYLQCALDGEAPYALVGDACEAPPNIPMAEEESNMGGLAAIGAVSISGPMGNLSASLHDISFIFTETLNRSGTVDFRLEEFTADASTVSYGSFVFSDPSVRLVAPASGRVSGESISFPPGSLRMEVTSAITVEGEPMFNGKLVAGEYVNTEWATATRTVDGKFSFAEAGFETGGYRFVLNTEEGSVVSWD